MLCVRVSLNKLSIEQPSYRWCGRHNAHVTSLQCSIQISSWRKKDVASGHFWYAPWTSCQIRKVVGCACTGTAGNVSPPPRVSDPDMHYGTCVTHVPGCMPGSLTSSFLWSRWRGKRSRHSRLMRNPQFYVSGTRPMRQTLSWWLKILRCWQWLLVKVTLLWAASDITWFMVCNTDLTLTPEDKW